MEVTVELEGVNGEWFTLAGPGAGDKGVYLGTGVNGLYDPPVKVVWEEPGNYPGSRYLNHRVLRRDIVFGVEILNDEGDGSWLSRDSEWRKAWSFERDCKLYVTHPVTGRRYLKLRLGESPEVDWFTDPTLNSLNRVGMVAVAADPFWYEDDVVFSAVTKTDTRFDPAPLPWPWPQVSYPKETLFIDVPEVNPTDQVIWPVWTVPGCTEKPAAPWIPGLPWLGAPQSRAAIWTLPDYSFQDDEHKNRRLRLPNLLGGLRTLETYSLGVAGTQIGTAGTFRLTFNGATTGDIDIRATAQQLEAALAALPSIGGAQHVDVTGGPVFGPLGIIEWSRSPWMIALGGKFEGVDQPDMTVHSFNLTNGDRPRVQITKLADGATAVAENCVVDTDPRHEQIVSQSGSQVWARMNGVRFRHPIPPYTGAKRFEITAAGVNKGQMVTLRLARPWSRPWGLS